MLKTKKQTLGASALAVVLAATLCAPALAFAADPIPDDETKWGALGTESSASPQVSAAGGISSTEVTGTIKATTLKVTVPTKVTFWIDPAATPSAAAPTNFTGDSKIGQFTNPKNFEIKNYSVVDVYGYVSKVAATPVTLINSGDPEKPNGAPALTTKVFVGLADTAATLNYGTPADWLMVGEPATPYYAFNKTGNGKLAASTNGTTVATNGKFTMTIRGKVSATGWAENETFTVTPTFKVVTANPSTP